MLSTDGGGKLSRDALLRATVQQQALRLAGLESELKLQSEQLSEISLAAQRKLDSQTRRQHRYLRACERAFIQAQQTQRDMATAAISKAVLAVAEGSRRRWAGAVGEMQALAEAATAGAADVGHLRGRGRGRGGVSAAGEGTESVALGCIDGGDSEPGGGPAARLLLWLPLEREEEVLAAAAQLRSCS